MQQLAHGVGNDAETHGWLKARYSTHQCWVRAECLTNTQSAFQIFIYFARSAEKVLVSLVVSPTLLIYHAAAHVSMCVDSGL